jgi:PIN domain nuclease of toxin-antitoxin system
MRYLLDTHTFIWADNEPAKLPLKVADAIQNPKNEIFISIASLWEMQIKL